MTTPAKASQRHRDCVEQLLQEGHILHFAKEWVVKTLEKHFPEPSREPVAVSKRDGNWMDQFGCCKVCDGEIPYGHTEECDIYKLEKRIKELDHPAPQWLPISEAKRDGTDVIAALIYKGEIRELGLAAWIEDGEDIGWHGDGDLLGWRPTHFIYPPTGE